MAAALAAGEAAHPAVRIRIRTSRSFRAGRAVGVSGSELD